MLKFLGFLVVLGLAFAGGVYVGVHGPEAFFAKVRQLGGEVVAKTTSVEREQTVRSGVLNAKERLVQAKLDLLDKNYGKAGTDLTEAAQHLAQARGSAGEEARVRLAALMLRVSELAAEVKDLKPGVLSKLDAATKELDTLLGH